MTEVLEDGWQPQTPPGDTVLRDFVDSSVHYLAGVGRAVGAATVDDADVAGAHHGAEFPFANMSIVRRPLDHAQWSDALARVRDAFAGMPAQLLVRNLSKEQEAALRAAFGDGGEAEAHLAPATR